MIEKLNHIGIAVSSLDEHIPFYRDVLKLDYGGTEVVEDQEVRLADFRIGDVTIELIEPTTPNSSIAKFIEKRGEGLHHLSYQVDDIDAQIKELKRTQIRMIDDTPRQGLRGSQIAFLHPKSSAKVLTELTQVGS